MGKKSSGSTTTTSVQQADPWAGVQPYLAGLYNSAANTYANGPQGYYSGQTVANINPNLQGSWSGLYQKGMTPDPTLSMANNSAQAFMLGQGINTNQFANGDNAARDKIANGSFLASNSYGNGSMNGMDATAAGNYLTPAGNPYMSAMVQAAERPITENFQNAIAPALASQFSAAGRTGSGSHVAAFDQAAGTLGRQLSDTSSTMYGQAYQQERGLMEAAKRAEQDRQYNAYEGERNFIFNAQNANKTLQQSALDSERQRQFAATQLAPTLNQAGYYGLQQAQGVGQQIYNADQTRLDAAKAGYDYNRDEPFARLQQYNAILSGAAPYAAQSGSTTQNPPKASPFASIMGGGLMGGAIGGMIPALGGPMGALLGAGLGLFG